MPAPREIVVNSLATFAEQIEGLLAATLTRQGGAPYKGNWYRGIGSIGHDLRPSLYRHPVINDAEQLMTLERQMLTDFARQNILHGTAGAFGSDTEDFRALLVMQHYGVPTRLLDWTSNPFIALYFALTSAKCDGAGVYAEDAALWVLDPVTWNSHALADVSYGMDGPLTIEADAAGPYRPRKLVKGKLESNAIKSMYEHPVAFLGVANNARMFAQRGVFTLFGKLLSGMESQFAASNFPKDCLVKLSIPKTQIGALSERLLHIGYTDSVSYPDLHGLAMEIKRTRGFRT